MPKTFSATQPTSFYLIPFCLYRALWFPLFFSSNYLIPLTSSISGQNKECRMDEKKRSRRVSKPAMSKGFEMMIFWKNYKRTCIQYQFSSNADTFSSYCVDKMSRCFKTGHIPFVLTSAAFLGLLCNIPTVLDIGT